MSFLGSCLVGHFCGGLKSHGPPAKHMHSIVSEAVPKQGCLSEQGREERL